MNKINKAFQLIYWNYLNFCKFFFCIAVTRDLESIPFIFRKSCKTNKQISSNEPPPVARNEYFNKKRCGMIVNETAIHHRPKSQNKLNIYRSP